MLEYITKLVRILSQLPLPKLLIVGGIVLVFAAAGIALTGSPTAPPTPDAVPTEQPHSALVSVMWVLIGIGASLIVAGLVIALIAPERRFTDWGMIDLWLFQGVDDMGALLGQCRERVIILKTWFPEDGKIAAGLDQAFMNGANVQLVLCNPWADILGIRSTSADVLHRQAAKWIRRGLDVVKKWAHRDCDFKIGLYNAWPGCPVIWADGRIFMGFYFRKYPSPQQRWIEVRAKSPLADVLDEQLTGLWKRAFQITNTAQLDNWLSHEIVQRDSNMLALLKGCIDDEGMLDSLNEWLAVNPLEDLSKWLDDDSHESLEDRLSGKMFAELKVWLDRSRQRSNEEPEA